MIYTVTFNPSLDYTILVNDFSLGKTNRTEKEQLFPGGKGINVSTVLTNCHIPNTALGFIAGFTGNQIEQMAKAAGINCDFISLKNGISRINVKMQNYDGTEINGMGPQIQTEELELLRNRLRQLNAGDVVVLAGSIPSCISSSVYYDIMEELSKKGILFIVDATKDLLLPVLPLHPFLVKPNHHELGDMFDTVMETKADVIVYARRLQEMGARNVIVSMAAEGAVFLTEEGRIYETGAPEGQLCNAVGAGDSMVAGFLAGWQEREDYAHAFKMAVAAGSASAFSETLATGEEIEDLYKKISL